MTLNVEEFRQVDPFGFWPRRPSALVARPDTDDSDPGDYAFHTPYVYSHGDSVRFQVTIEGLGDQPGTLVLHLNELPPEGDAISTCIVAKTVPLDYIRDASGRIEVEGIAKDEHRYALVGVLDAAGSTGATGLEVSVTARSATEAYRRQLQESRTTIFSKPALFMGLYDLVDREPTLEKPVSQACTVPQFREPAYQRWLDAMKRTLHFHRKQWEFVYIMQALDAYGALRHGHHGLGFGVGEEPLPAVMATLGCHIVATDLPAEDDRVAGWSGSGQHSHSLDGMRQPHLIDDETLSKHVSFRPVDMTDIPDDLVDFDYTWSSCALEHVGSIAAGLDFIERSIACLRPGGIAVHTTELNLLSNDNTLDHAGTVLFRRRDFEEIAARLILKGHQVMPLNFTAGSSPLDDHIDVPPFSADTHFKLLISRYLTTSFGIIVRRAGEA